MEIPNIELSRAGADLQVSATLEITAKAKEMATQGLNIVSMCAGEPDFDTPDFIKNATIDALKNGETKYTRSSGRLDLCRALSKKFKEENNLDYKPTQIIVSPGGKFSLMAAIQVICNPEDEVIIPSPCWISYPEMVKSTGAKVVLLPTYAENQYCIDIEDLKNAITSKTKLLIINSPSNPIGNIYRKELLEEIARVVIEKNILLISDEMYEKMSYDVGYEHFSIASLNEQIYQRTITINGFSKAFSMTGWRLGYLGAPEWIVDKIAAYQSHATSNCTSFAQVGALAALTGPQEDLKKMITAFHKRRDLIYSLICEIPGIKTTKPRGAFYIFPDISEFGMDSIEFCEKLLQEELLAIIPGGPFGAPANIRLSYACGEENIIEACKRLKRFCERHYNP